MKRNLILLLLFVSASFVQAQKSFDDMDKMIKYFSKIEGVTYNVKNGDKADLPFAERVDSIESLIVEECSDKDVQDFVSLDMSAFKGYEVVFRVADEEDTVTLLAKPMKKGDDEKFSEVVFVVQEKGEGVLFRIKGVLSKPDPSIIGGLVTSAVL